MTVVIDIACPDCERRDAVRKVDIRRYRCEECGREFGHEEVLPE